MKIKEVEELVHMNGQTIRYYDKLGFLHPNRDENGYRNYTMEDIKILKRIRFLRELDISLELIGIILDNPDELERFTNVPFYRIVFNFKKNSDYILINVNGCLCKLYTFLK